MNTRQVRKEMTEEQARYIWKVLLDVSGQKDIIVVIRHAERGEQPCVAEMDMMERRRAVAG